VYTRVEGGLSLPLATG